MEGTVGEEVGGGPGQPHVQPGPLPLRHDEPGREGAAEEDHQTDDHLGRLREDPGKQCDGGHEHRRIQGAETSATAHYPWQFARGVLKAYLKTMVSPGEHTAFAVTKTGGEIPKDGQDLDETELVPDEEWQGSRRITFSEQIRAKWAGPSARGCTRISGTHLTTSWPAS